MRVCVFHRWFLIGRVMFYSCVRFVDLLSLCAHVCASLSFPLSVDYQQISEDKVPFKWLPLESIEDRVFTSKRSTVTLSLSAHVYYFLCSALLSSRLSPLIVIH